MTDPQAPKPIEPATLSPEQKNILLKLQVTALSLNNQILDAQSKSREAIQALDAAAREIATTLNIDINRYALNLDTMAFELKK